MSGGARRSLVGRSRELAELAEGLDGAASGAGRLFVVAGEGGIGKTRLVTEIARLASERGFLVAWGRCAEVGGAPAFWPWIQILRALRRARTRGGAKDLRNDREGAGDAEGGARPTSLDRLLPELRGPSSSGPSSSMIDPSQARLALFEDVVDALREIEPPLLLLFEDLHAADPSSLALVHFLAREIERTPIVAIATCRDQEVRGQADRGAAVQRIAREGVYLPLRRFGAAEVRELLERYAADAAPLADGIVERVLQATEGNVLFVEEIARALGRNPEGFPVLPNGVRDAIAERLSRLAPEALAVLGAASVLGRELDADVVARVLDRDVADVRKIFEHAEAAGVLVPLRPEVHAFGHVLVHDVVYRQLPADRRATLHAKVADVLAASRAPERAAAEIASHLLEAAPAVGVERAIRGSLAAAERATAAYAFEDASAIVERAFATLGAAAIPPRARAEGLILAGEARIRTGDAERGRSACLEAAAIARTIGDPGLLAAAALAYGAEITIGHSDETLLSLLRDALEALPADALAARARVLARLAGAEQPALDPREPMARAREAIALARRSEDPFTLRIALQFAGSALVDYADPAERAPLAREMRDLALEARDPPSVFRATLRLFFDHLESGDFPAALTTEGELDGVAAGLGWPRLRASAAMARACIALARGRFAEADRAFDEARAIGRAANPHAPPSETEILFQVGRAVLEDHAERIGPLLDQISTPQVLIAQWFTFLRAFARARAGDLEGARRAAQFVSRSAALFQVEPAAVQAAAELAALLDDRAWAEELHAPACALRSRFASWGQHAMVVLYPMDAIVGLLESTLGRLDEARASFAEAERRAERATALPMLPWILHWRAIAEGKAGKPAEAAALATRAAMIAEELGMDRVVARIERTRPAGELAPATRAPVLSTSLPRLDVPFELRRDGELWRLRVGAGGEAGPTDATLLLKDSRGLRMLAYLLAAPGREVHALLLAGEGVDPGDLGSAGDVIDARAIEAYRSRIDDLRDGIEEAERFGDAPRAAGLREELDFLVREVAAGVGLGGRGRRAASAAERARVNVQRRLKDAIKRIGELSPTVGEYLGWTVRTGTFCVYQPGRSAAKR